MKEEFPQPHSSDVSPLRKMHPLSYPLISGYFIWSQSSLGSVPPTIYPHHKKGLWKGNKPWPFTGIWTPKCWCWRISPNRKGSALAWPRAPPSRWCTKTLGAGGFSSLFCMLWLQTHMKQVLTFHFKWPLLYKENRTQCIQHTKWVAPSYFTS